MLEDVAIYLAMLFVALVAIVPWVIGIMDILSHIRIVFV
jgi:hypothetical protein